MKYFCHFKYQSVKHLIALFFLLSALSKSVAQPVRGFNRIDVSIAQQLYLNSLYIVNDERAAYHPLSALNTAANNYGIAFQRVTRHGFTMSAGVYFGNQHHNVSIRYPLTSFDPQAKPSIYTDNISATASYVMPKIAFGYRKVFSEKWAVFSNVGFSIKLFFDGDYRGETIFASYRHIGTDTLFIEDILHIDSRLGDPFHRNPYTYFENTLHCIEFSIGVERIVKSRFVKNFSLSLEAATNRFLGNGEMSQGVLLDIKQYSGQPTQEWARDRYFNKNYSLGLRLGIGLWK